MQSLGRITADRRIPATSRKYYARLQRSARQPPSGAAPVRRHVMCLPNTKQFALQHRSWFAGTTSTHLCLDQSAKSRSRALHIIHPVQHDVLRLSRGARSGLRALARQLPRPLVGRFPNAASDHPPGRERGAQSDAVNKLRRDELPFPSAPIS